MANLNVVCALDTKLPPVPYAFDECCLDSIPADYTVVENGGIGTAQNPLVIVRTCTFADPCRNEKSVTQTLTIKDEDEIVLPEKPEDYTVTCLSDAKDPPNLVATVGCGIYVERGLTTVETGNECLKTFVHTI